MISKSSDHSNNKARDCDPPDQTSAWSRLSDLLGNLVSNPSSSGSKTSSKSSYVEVEKVLSGNTTKVLTWEKNVTNNHHHHYQPANKSPPSDRSATGKISQANKSEIKGSDNNSLNGANVGLALLVGIGVGATVGVGASQLFSDRQHGVLSEDRITRMNERSERMRALRAQNTEHDRAIED